MLTPKQKAGLSEDLIEFWYRITNSKVFARDVVRALNHEEEGRCPECRAELQMPGVHLCGGRCDSGGTAPPPPQPTERSERCSHPNWVECDSSCRPAPSPPTKGAP